MHVSEQIIQQISSLKYVQKSLTNSVASHELLSPFYYIVLSDCSN